MSWRPAAPGDDAAIVEMCLALNREDPGPRPVPAAHTERTLAEFRAAPTRGRALVCEENDAVCGYGLLSFVWSNELGGEICLVDELYVKPSARGHGHGQEFLRKLLAGPYVAVDLEVTPDNHRARGFYLGLGFKAAKNTHMRFRR